MQYFVFDFHMAPVMLFDKIISFTVGREHDEELMSKKLLENNLCWSVLH